VGLEAQAPTLNENDPGLDASPIENELPAYRAISPLALTSLFFGLLSALCFADLWFLIAAALAIGFGVWATVRIKRLPDVLTGSGFAQAGIGLAVVFALSSVTSTVVQKVVRTRTAEEFARKYESVLNTRSLADASWYKVPPPSRRGVSPQKALDQMRSGSKDPRMFDMAIGGMGILMKQLEGNPKRKVHFVEIESTHVDGVTSYANALYSVEDSDPTLTDSGHVLVSVRTDTDMKRDSWYIHDVLYPYKPASYVPKVKPVDDGHGHGH
jgi:hypothetical protein